MNCPECDLPLTRKRLCPRCRERLCQCGAYTNRMTDARCFVCEEERIRQANWGEDEDQDIHQCL